MPTARRKAYWVYVLYSDTGGRFYVGLSEDPQRRLASHNAGKSRWTSRHVPWRIVFERRFPSLTEARRFENLLKRQHGGAGLFKHTGLRPEEFGPSQGS